MEKDTKSQVYQDALDAYKEAVVKAPTLSFTAFCRQNNIPHKGMQHWLDRKNILISEVRTHTLQEHGYVSSIPTKKCTSAIYEATWHGYIEALKTENLTMSLYCLQHDVPYRGMQKWMEGKNLSVADAKIKAGLSPESDRGLTRREVNIPEALARRLSKAMDMYKHKLRENPKYSLRAFCKEKNINYRSMTDWMAHLGVTVTQLRQAAVLEDRAPRSRKKVFIQFTPNGGSNSDRLRGVKIQMADGNNILVQECTVISLCAFINQYNNDLKRGKKTCLN